MLLERLAMRVERARGMVRTGSIDVQRKACHREAKARHRRPKSTGTPNRLVPLRDMKCRSVQGGAAVEPARAVSTIDAVTAASSTRRYLRRTARQQCSADECRFVSSC